MGEPRRILIIDDEDDIRELARISLERVGGMQVSAASSGEEGIALAASDHFDAILLDAMMPGLDGRATMERLKSDPATEQIPVVFLTGSIQAVERQGYKDAGAAGVLGKPFDPMQLANEVRACLGWDD